MAKPTESAARVGEVVCAIIDAIASGLILVLLGTLGAPLWAATGFAVVVFAVLRTGDFVVRKLRKV